MLQPAPESVAQARQSNARRSTRRSAIGLTVAVLALLVGLLAFNHKSTSERSLGEPTFARLLEIYPRINQGEYFELVKAAGIRLISALPPEQRRGWTIALINNDQPMTLALPGRIIAVSDGNKKIAQNTHMIATLLAHEIAHSLHGDSMTNFTHALQRSIGPSTFSTWLSAQSRENRKTTLDYQLKQLQNLLQTQYRADAENRAERFAVDLLQGACLDAQYGALTWERLYAAAPAMAHRHGPMQSDRLQTARIKAARQYRLNACKPPSKASLPAKNLLTQ